MISNEKSGPAPAGNLRETACKSDTQISINPDKWQGQSGMMNYHNLKLDLRLNSTNWLQGEYAGDDDSEESISVEPVLDLNCRLQKADLLEVMM